jgi:hypothetical protein
MRVASTILAFSIAMVAGTVSDLPAQGVEAWVRPGTGVAAGTSGPFAALLDRASDLGLSREQRNRIGEIRRQLVRDNERLQAQLRDAEVWGVTTEAEKEAIAAVREEIRENAAGAERAVAEVLTPEQHQRAGALEEGILLAYPTPRAEADEAVDAPEESAEGGARVAALPTTVRIENLNYYDATVYVYSGPHRQRLGNVTGLGTRTFILPRNFPTGASPVRFEVRHLARTRSRMSNSVFVNAGDEVHVRIPPA